MYLQCAYLWPGDIINETVVELYSAQKQLPENIAHYDNWCAVVFVRSREGQEQNLRLGYRLVLEFWLEYVMAGMLYRLNTNRDYRNIYLNFSQRQLPRKLKTRLVIIECAGYIFWQFSLANIVIVLQIHSGQADYIALVFSLAIETETQLNRFYF